MIRQKLRLTMKKKKLIKRKVVRALLHPLKHAYVLRPWGPPGLTGMPTYIVPGMKSQPWVTPGNIRPGNITGFPQEITQGFATKVGFKVYSLAKPRDETRG